MLLTYHVKKRAAEFERLGLVTLREVVKTAIEYKIRQGIQHGGQTNIVVRKLGRVVNVEIDGKMRYGDEIHVVVDRRNANDPGRITTVMLRYSKRETRTFRPYDAIEEEHHLSASHKSYAM